jgi:hypothetical protein
MGVRRKIDSTVSPEFIVYLLAARQTRLLVRAYPAEADAYKSRCRYWLSMAHKAQGPPLP